ncbi:hypothetical protein L873DRAFT_1695373 [Choiromyces venosus 120613-1]|uniref:Meiotically up-regulated protein Msb1/Mug8 domain-containing protein n=1 Tax=Choiromyces venosus 120613-1 TaxID=1336337 RepID=A0A3N4JIE7_9PEZI|nr:hypothetical protein L873DRAFT_1695373 [Choiromyces venosus 120613-1]
MPAFLNKVFKRDHAGSSKKIEQVTPPQPQEVKYQDAWLRTEVTPEQVQELLRGCTQEIKSRGLSTPFLLLPFRPNSDASAARTFIRNFFNPEKGPLRGPHLQQELRLTEPVVLCSTLKWCWSRLPGGVVTWDVYELFRQGEVDSSMARDSFATFIPISAESEARSKIIFDFFDLISAIAAHGKHNGLGGMKLSRLAGWWAFEHSDMGWGFEGGYTSWSRAADATMHLFFAYLRSLSPADGTKGVSVLPISLKALMASVDYPPTAPAQLQSKTVRVVMTVETVSPTPFSLLRRARNFQFRESDLALRALMDYEDPVQALTEECKRVLNCISSTNQSSSAFKSGSGLQDQSWSRFQDLGFSGLLEESEGSGDDDGLSMTGSETFRRRRASTQPTPPTPREERTMDLARPTTPSWADFMVAGFGDRDQAANRAAPLLLSPDKFLPPIDNGSRVRSSQSNRKIVEDNLDPGELASVSPLTVDDAFWWVWISSLAGEESTARKAVFGRCALVETVIKGGRWLVVEEKVKGAATAVEDATYLPAKEKKKSRRGRLTRRKSVGRVDIPIEQPKQFDPSMGLFNRTNIGPDQTAKIQAAAAALRQQRQQQEFNHLRPREDGSKPNPRTNSVFTLQPVILSEATPAMKWASKYDRDAIREAYLKGLPMPEKKDLSRVDTDRPLPPPPPHEEQEERPERKERQERQERPRPEPVEPKPEQSTQPPTPVTKQAPVALASPSTPSTPRRVPMTLPSPRSNGSASPAFDSRSQTIPGSPKSQPSAHSTPEKSKKPKASRFMNLFSSSRKADPTSLVGRRISQLEPPNGGGLGVPAQNANRRLSMNRKKNTPVDFNGDAAKLKAPLPPAVEKPSLPLQADLRRQDSDQPSTSQVSSNEERAATQVFSSFDQGPLSDQPAFIPDDSVSTSEPISPIESSPTVPEKEADDVSMDGAASPASPAEAIPAQDRWAQIRKNAAERAKVVPKASDEYTRSDARGSIDDGETSGEETIESRVARIKARVAELTGGIDTTTRV